MRFWLGQATDWQTGQKFNREIDLWNETSVAYLARGPAGWEGCAQAQSKAEPPLSADIPGWTGGPGPRQKTHVRAREEVKARGGL